MSFWKPNSVFASFYIKDMQFVFDNCWFLGPFMLTRELIG